MAPRSRVTNTYSRRRRTTALNSKSKGVRDDFTVSLVHFVNYVRGRLIRQVSLSEADTENGRMIQTGTIRPDKPLPQSCRLRTGGGFAVRHERDEEIDACLTNILPKKVR